MPYPNEHAARVVSPDEFEPDSFRRKVIAPGVSIVVGKLKDGDGKMVTQAYRFDKDKYTPAEAKKWLKDNDISTIGFEAASDVKEASLGGELSQDERSSIVRDAFYKAHIQSSDSPGGCYVADVFADKLVVREGEELFVVAYMMDGKTITFAPRQEWIKVISTYVPVMESLRIHEASEPDGSKWAITIIGAGVPDDIVMIGNQEYVKSLNGRLYSTAALKASVPIWEGIKVYDNHLTDAEFEAKQGMRSVLNELVGVIVEPVWDSAKRAVTGVLKVIDSKLREKLKNAFEAGVLGSIGLSIDAMARGDSKQVGNSMFDVVEELVKAFSVDIVADPAAGGRVARMIASRSVVNLMEVNDMTKEEILEVLQSAIGTALQPINDRLTAIEESQKPKVDEPVNDPVVDAPVADAAGKAELSAAMEKLEAIQRQMQIDGCALALASKLQESGLPQEFRDLVAEQFKGKIFEVAELEAAIKKQRDALVKVSESGRVVLPSDRISVSPVTELDRYELAFLRLVAGPTRFAEMVTKENAAYHGIPAIARYIEAGKPAMPVARRLSEWYYEFTEDLDGIGKFNNKRLREAQVTSSAMASIVKNTVNILLAADYSARLQWWTPIVRQEDVDTLDQATLVRVFGLSTLSSLSEGAVYGELAWADEEETAVAQKYGNYIGVTLETFLKDKLNVVRSLPMRLANAWYNTISGLVSNVFTINSAVGPTLGDTGALFNATAVTSAGGHANLLTTALSHAQFSTVRTAMMKQTDQPLGAGTRLLVEPRYILVPPDLENTALVIRNSEALPGSANNDYNQFYGKVDPIVVPEWTDTNNWAAVADPARFPAIWLIWLRGRRTPELFTSEDETSGAMFANDEMRFKVRLWAFQMSATDNCAPVSDFRPLHKSNVA